jgi:hypothetical protein
MRSPLLFACLTGEPIARGSNASRRSRNASEPGNNRPITGRITGTITGGKQAPVLPDMVGIIGAIPGIFVRRARIRKISRSAVPRIVAEILHRIEDVGRSGNRRARSLFRMCPCRKMRGDELFSGVSVGCKQVRFCNGRTMLVDTGRCDENPRSFGSRLRKSRTGTLSEPEAGSRPGRNAGAPAGRESPAKFGQALELFDNSRVRIFLCFDALWRRANGPALPVCVGRN